jgi:hypothetical protein
MHEVFNVLYKEIVDPIIFWHSCHETIEYII